MRFESDIRREKQLAETRAANPGRPVRIDNVTGCVVVGPTLDEVMEVREMMDQDERQETERLKQPKVALDFIRRVDLPEEPAFGGNVRKVYEVFDAGVSESFRSSSSYVVARVRTRHGKPFIVVVGESHWSGTMIDPPDYDAFITEVKCPKLEPERYGPKKGKPIENNGCDSSDTEHVEGGKFKCRACGLSFTPRSEERKNWPRHRG